MVSNVGSIWTRTGKIFKAKFAFSSVISKSLSKLPNWRLNFSLPSFYPHRDFTVIIIINNNHILGLIFLLFIIVWTRQRNRGCGRSCNNDRNFFVLNRRIIITTILSRIAAFVNRKIVITGDLETAEDPFPLQLMGTNLWRSNNFWNYLLSEPNLSATPPSPSLKTSTC